MPELTVNGAEEAPAPAATMPAEWEAHERCLIAWPGRPGADGRLTRAMKVDFALAAKAISEWEPVLMLARPGFGVEARAACGPDVEIVEAHHDENWLRDSGPLFVRGAGGALHIVDFAFNQWGDLLPPLADSAMSGAAVARRLGLGRTTVPLVVEGGAFGVDGAGSALAMAPTLLDERRNPGISPGDLETAFSCFLGVRHTIWLEHGLAEDRTGGHLDNVAVWIGPGRVLCQVEPDGADPNHRRLAANRAALAAAVTADGHRLEIVDFDLLPYREWAGRRIALPYLNFYLGRDCVIVPLACLPSDAEALARLCDVFPDRQVVGVPATNLWRRGGGIHCLTREQPAMVALQ